MAAINNSQDNLLNKKNEYHKVVFYDYDNKERILNCIVHIEFNSALRIFVQGQPYFR